MNRLLKRFASVFESVEPDFDAKAVTEIAFRRIGGQSLAPEELEFGYNRVSSHEFAPEADGIVQSETQQAVLDALIESLEALSSGLEPGEILVVENGPGQDHPKTRQRISNLVVRGENRLHFHYEVRPSLRVTVYHPREPEPSGV